MELLDTEVDVRTAEYRDVFFESLYEHAFPAFARFAGKMNASFDDAKDVFQDAMLIYYEKSLNGSLVIETSPEAYVVGIARHLWLRKFNREKHQVSLVDDHFEYSAETEQPDKDESRLLKLLERAGRRCMDLLSEFYFGKKSLKELATHFGYRSEHSVAVQKYKCIGKLRDVIKSKSIQYDDLNP